MAFARSDMERMIFDSILAELSGRGLEYLYAMARDTGVSQSAIIAKRMNITVSNVLNFSKVLVEQGIIYAPRAGQVDFEMPMLREYLRSKRCKYLAFSSS